MDTEVNSTVNEDNVTLSSDDSMTRVTSSSSDVTDTKALRCRMTSHATMPPSTSVTSQRFTRHKVAVTQLILIMTVYVVSFVPLLLLINGVTKSRLVAYIYYINHASTFFIYLAVNKEFRKQANELMKRLPIIRRDNETAVFTLR